MWLFHLTAGTFAPRVLTSWVFLLAPLGLLAPVQAVALERVAEFGENPGRLDMYLHRPDDFRTALPLVVALHGCRQTAEDFDDETGLIALAEEDRKSVV